MMALRFLRGPNQPRSRFKFEGIKKVDGLTLALVSFEERSQPRLIASEDDAAARGRFWIEPATGRVVRSELSFQTGRKIIVRSLVRVQYADEPTLKLWMPVSMQEDYFVEGVLLEGKASYGNFRRFTVATSTEVKTP
jgi:hypothetical protein